VILSRMAGQAPAVPRIMVRTGTIEYLYPTGDARACDRIAYKVRPATPVAAGAKFSRKTPCAGALGRGALASVLGPELLAHHDAPPSVPLLLLEGGLQRRDDDKLEAELAVQTACRCVVVEERKR
jgi:hypothetical protein